MKITCTWCEQAYPVNAQKALKTISKKGFLRSKCPICKSLNIVSRLEDSEIGDVPVADASRGTGSGPASKKRFQTPWVNSIQFQMSSILLLLIACILGSFLLYNYLDAKKRINDELVRFSSNTATRLSGHIAGPLWGVETEQIAAAIASEMLDRQIYAIHIFDQDRKGVLVGKQRDDKWQIEASGREVQGDYIAADSDVSYKDERIGNVKVFVTPRFMKEDLQRSTMNLLLTTLVLFAVIILAIFITLRKIVIHPIAALTDAAKRMSRGDLNTKIHIDSHNEIGSLVNALKRMQTSLILSFKRLQQQPR